MEVNILLIKKNATKEELQVPLSATLFKAKAISAELISSHLVTTQLRSDWK